MTETTTIKSNRPDFHAYHVQDRGEGKKAIWTKVGIAYRHKDGKGLNIQLIANVLDGRLTLREVEEPAEADNAEPAA